MSDKQDTIERFLDDAAKVRSYSTNECPKCGGSGSGQEQTPWKTNPCDRCDGTGIIESPEDME